MQVAYEIRILSENASTSMITEVLGIQPTKSDPNYWRLVVIEKKDDPCFDYVEKFLEILDPKLQRLEDVGVKRSEITIWYLYEYESQCNMEFPPSDMKRLGERGLALCVSCWESDIPSEKVLKPI